jgi:hypothetical protein
MYTIRLKRNPLLENKYLEAREVDKGSKDAKESCEPRKAPIDRLVSEMGFNKPKNSILLIGLVLPRLQSYVVRVIAVRMSSQPLSQFEGW